MYVCIIFINMCKYSDFKVKNKTTKKSADIILYIIIYEIYPE